MTVKTKGTLNRKLAAVDFGIRNGLNISGQLVVDSVGRVFEQFAPKGIATGELRQSIGKTPVVVENTKYTIRVGPSAKHGKWVHLGRKPGGRFPPILEIRKWIEVKGITPIMKTRRNKRTGRFRKSTKTEMEQAKQSLAYLIARKIALRGIKPYPFLKVGYDVVKARIPGIIIEEVKKSLQGA